jgi:hypothetical protein
MTILILPPLPGHMTAFLAAMFQGILIHVRQLL